jgi:hypothetical protein
MRGPCSADTLGRCDEEWNRFLYFYVELCTGVIHSIIISIISYNTNCNLPLV